jgi:hypothetical protein
MLLAAMLAAAVAAAPAAVDTARPRLHVDMEVVDGSGLLPEDLRIIARGIEAIWSPVLDLVVASPGEGGRFAASDRVHLTLTTGTLPGSEATGLGWIQFVNGEPEPAITVSVTAARHLMEAGSWRGKALASLPKRISRVFLQRTLARAVAHEIGHYLLRSRTHDSRGLMRPVFTVDEMMDGRAALVRLSAEEVARLRAGTDLIARQSEGGT